MKCPHCYVVSKCSVTETRQDEGQIFRTRSCLMCDTNFVTVESTSATLTMPKAVRSTRRLRDAKAKRIKVQSTDVFKVWNQ